MQPQTDPTADTRTSFPQTPHDATVTLVIQADPGEGGALILSSTVKPSDRTWDHKATERLFESVRVTPKPGRYVFVYTLTDGLQTLELPEGTTDTDTDVRVLKRQVTHQMHDNLVALIDDLTDFPNEDSIQALTREIASIILQKAVEASPLDSGELPNPGTIEVRPTSSFAQSKKSLMERVLSGFMAMDVSVQQVSVMGNIAYQLDTSGEQPVLFVSYARDTHPYATFLNDELATRVRAALPVATAEVVTNTLVEIEVQRHFADTVESSLYTTFEIDDAKVADQVEQRFDKIRKELAAQANEDVQEDTSDDSEDSLDDDSEDGIDLTSSAPTTDEPTSPQAM